MLASLKDEYEEKNVRFLSLTVHEGDDRAAVNTFLEQSDATSLTAGRASEDVTATLRQMAGIRPQGVPASVLITADGEVIGGHLGAPDDASTAREWIEPVVP